MGMIVWLFYNAFGRKTKTPNYKHLNTINYVAPNPMPKKTEEEEIQSWIEEFSKYNKYEARKKFWEYKNNGVRFPDKAYAYIQRKINGEVYFTDEEYEKRMTEGKPVMYIYPVDILIENIMGTMMSKEITFENKSIAMKEFVNNFKGGKRLEASYTIYRRCIELLKQRITEEAFATLKSERYRITRLYTKGEISPMKIPFENIHNALTGQPLVELDVLQKKKKSKKE